MDEMIAGESGRIPASAHQPLPNKNLRTHGERPTGVRRVEIGGVHVDALQAVGLRDLLYELVHSPGRSHIATVNVEYLRRASTDERLREIIASTTVALPDGMPVAWLLGLSMGIRPVRATGHDLAHAAFEISAAYGPSLFFLGAADGVGERAAEAVRRVYPGVSIAGTYAPPLSPYPFTPEQNQRIAGLVNASGACIVLAAFGCPKQDYWLADNLHLLGAKVGIGVGCVFDVLAGSVNRAPRVMQSSGLEWLYRLRQEPRRLFGRYMRDGMFVASLALRETFARAKGGGPAG